MANPPIAEMLKYADLQMAAEALYSFNTKKLDPASLIPGDHYAGPIDPAVLTTGNEHASRFTQTQADEFVTQWKVVDHISNTTTGFSGTLFQNKETLEYVISFRSTEFIDDVARDCVATNAMEIKAYGWAFGQISDMEAWFAQLKQKDLLPTGSHYSVTNQRGQRHLPFETQPKGSETFTF